MIGIGLGDEKDITVRGLEIIKRCSSAYLEYYTSILQCPVEKLEAFYGKKLVLADRDLVETGPDRILADAKTGDVAFLVAGDVLSATTHVDLFLRASRAGVKVRVVPNASILTAVGVVGLELYKYGRTISIGFPEKGWKVETFYDGVRDNLKAGLHTLCLLDIKVKEPSVENMKKGKDVALPPRFMTVSQGIQALLDVETSRKEKVFIGDTLCVGCARLGCDDQFLVSGKASDLLKVDFGKPPHCLIVPGKLHFVEEEMMELWRQKQID